jgi:hypothetical protein
MSQRQEKRHHDLLCSAQGRISIHLHVDGGLLYFHRSQNIDWAPSFGDLLTLAFCCNVFGISAKHCPLDSNGIFILSESQHDCLDEPTDNRNAPGLLLDTNFLNRYSKTRRERPVLANKSSTKICFVAF